MLANVETSVKPAKDVYCLYCSTKLDFPESSSDAPWEKYIPLKPF